MSQPERLTIHDQQWWVMLEARLNEQYGQFEGMPYAQVTDETRTDMLVTAINHLNDLHLVLRTLALESHPKRTHAPRKKGEVGEP
jgi:hypothetical protein